MIPMSKRFSTWVNLISMILAAAMIYIPDIGLSAQATAQVMLGSSVVISIAQWIKQNATIEPDDHNQEVNDAS